MKKKFVLPLSVLGAVVIFCSLLALTGCNHSNAPNIASASPAASASAHNNHSATAAPTEVAQNVPHYFDDPDQAKPFPKTLDPAKVNGPAAKKAYETARRIPEVLVQQPCYCYCDRGFGHGSLLDCHQDNHSAD